MFSHKDEDKIFQNVNADTFARAFWHDARE